MTIAHSCICTFDQHGAAATECFYHREMREERDRLKTALDKVQSAAKVLVAGADRRVLDATAHEPAARAAIATLDSERAANEILTNEVERLTAALVEANAELARLRLRVSGAQELS